MNRRDLLKGSSALVVGSAVFGSTANFMAQPHSLMPLEKCNRWACGSTLEHMAREAITETGKWKRELSLPRKDRPMVYSLYGCCGCDVSVGADGEWAFTTRPLTPTERRSFKEEYGNQAALLLSMQPMPDLEIRGFVLNGRREGWNLSVKKTGSV